jgi:hypothetical protein
MNTIKAGDIVTYINDKRGFNLFIVIHVYSNYTDESLNNIYIQNLKTRGKFNTVVSKVRRYWLQINDVILLPEFKYYLTVKHFAVIDNTWYVGISFNNKSKNILLSDVISECTLVPD